MSDDREPRIREALHGVLHQLSCESAPLDLVEDIPMLEAFIEDYADEWCWRAAMYWRWQPIESRKLLMRRIGHEVLADFPAPHWLAGWYFGRRQMATYLRGDGLSTETEPHIKQHYLDLLDAMNALLDDQPYLLGTHPTLVDIGLFGPMFRHYAQDQIGRASCRERV